MSRIEPLDHQIKEVAKWARIRRAKGNPNGRGKAKPVTLAAQPTSWDRGADGPANQERLRTEPVTDFDPETGKETPNPNGVKRRRRDDWVTRYHRAGHLTDKQAATAQSLRMAAEGMRERDPLAALPIDRRAGQSDPEAARVDSRAWFRRMWAMVPVSSRPVVERVVLDDQPIWSGGGIVARDRHMLRLCAGLDAIA
ncbi:hypothetical protein HOY34_13790 [Xinfangfangia sp. D13-10-4-6]|uniref:hypothetical protein n=1 Tax=Pseudogemmobacter hezensis TaxID=2737662 RepID=UPI00155764C0|nr:hypothetical protein [Pseudogemmobacter hezensis]NPD16267.1 hypothetical protein [Pseudogemmobacter hezensis]